MVKAAFNNFKAGKIKEGASTISQQLIKNTHLTSEKSYKRKIKEIIITKKMEKEIPKKDILESYLNVIYFGNGCYGIENASNYYFSKSAKELNLEEAALLAGIIKSPYNYSPITNTDKCEERRNLVLRNMYTDKKISYHQLNSAVSKPINLKINKQATNKLNTYSEMALDEAISLLKMPAKQIAIGQYKIYTYLDTDKQEKLYESVIKQNIESDYAVCSANIEKGAIEAYVASSAYKIKDNPRQPGSTIKPILVYAPALEENKITTLTKINDEKIDISGYSPKNVGGTYSGYVSVEECVERSLNIPAVKCLSYVGIDKAKKYASKCGISFDESDNGYALALGGMTKGVNVVELTNAYIALANNGIKRDCKFIKYITDKDGNIIYVNPKEESRVFRDDTAYLMTKMLISASKKGTSKQLSDCEYMVASKTGTVGSEEKLKNVDAWNVSYTTEDVVAVWLGNMDKTLITYSGSKQPVSISKHYLNSIYENSKPKDFNKPSSIETIEIDMLEYNKNNLIVRANEFIPERYKLKEEFSKFNLPSEESKNFITIQPPHLVGSVKNNKAILSFNGESYLTYELYKTYNNKTELVTIVSGKEGEITTEDKIQNNIHYSYYLIAKLKNFTNNTEVISEKSNSIQLIKSSDSLVIDNTANHSKDKWYI